MAAETALEMPPLAHLYVVFFVVISFVIFNAENMGQALSDIGGLFGAGGIPLVSAEAVYCLRSFALVLILAVLGATPSSGMGLSASPSTPPPVRSSTHWNPLHCLYCCWS